jgi:hypothetical protein
MISDRLAVAGCGIPVFESTYSERAIFTTQMIRYWGLYDQVNRIATCSWAARFPSFELLQRNCERTGRLPQVRYTNDGGSLRNDASMDGILAWYCCTPTVAPADSGARRERRFEWLASVPSKQMFLQIDRIELTP